MKKTIVIMMAALLILSCFGCGSSKEETADIDLEKVTADLCGSEYFPGVSSFDRDKLELKYAVDLSGMEEGVFYMPVDAEKANMFIIAKASEGNADVLFDEIDMIVDKYDHSWTDLVYNAAEAEKVENRTVVKTGNWYICVISDDNDAVINMITGK